MTGLLHIDGAPWQAGLDLGRLLSAGGPLRGLAAPRPGAPRSGTAAPNPRWSWKQPLETRSRLLRPRSASATSSRHILVVMFEEGSGGPLLEAWVWLATGLAILPSIWLWGLLVRRRGLRVVFAAGCLVEIVGVVASVLVPGMAGPLIAGVLLGGTFVAVTAFGLQAGRKLAAQAPRRALALMTASFGTGQILGPIAAGFVADRTGDFVLASLLAAAALLLSALLVLSSRQGAEAT